jgi:hypothetical protein
MSNPDLIEVQIEALTTGLLNGGFSLVTLRDMSELFKDAAVRLDAEIVTRIAAGANPPDEDA